MLNEEEASTDQIMHWNLSDFLDPQLTPPNLDKTYLIILNQPLSDNILLLWKKGNQ